MRGLMSVGVVVMLVGLIGAWLAGESRAQTMPQTLLAGAWTLNAELSDQPMERADGREGGDHGRRGSDFGRGGGGGRRGGFGRGGGGGFGRGAGADREAMTRMRDAMRDIMSPPQHLAITQTESMIVITSPDGRTTRLSPDATTIKDENTNIKRKTRWEGDRLISEINGVGPGKITQTYSVDPEHHQLRITTQMEGGSSAPRTLTHVYDADK